MTSQEIVYFEEGGVTVTNARAVMGGKTFAMVNITSVAMHEKPPNQLWAILFLLSGILGTLLFFAEQYVCGGFGLFLIVIAILMFRSSKTSYSVAVGSAGGETQALTSTDKDLINRIVIAMNEAIINRG